VNRLAEWPGVATDSRPSNYLEVERLAKLYVKRPKIVSLCGSTKFKDELQAAARDFTLRGYIVVGPAIFAHQGDPLTDEQKTDLDELHLRKIDLADEVYIVNVDGYIGFSTKRELQYAYAHGKRVTFLVKP
jgi:hypothetical protein